MAKNKIDRAIDLVLNKGLTDNERMILELNIKLSFLKTAYSTGIYFDGTDEQEPGKTIDDFLIGLTPTKIKKALPKHEIAESEKMALSYTGKERVLLMGSDEEKAQAKQLRKDRALVFFECLSDDEKKALFNTLPKKKQAKTTNTIEQNIVEVKQTPKLENRADTVCKITKGVFEGLKNKDGNTVSLINDSLIPVPLWTNRKGKGVVIAVSLNLEPEFLRDNGISLTGKKTLSGSAREVYSILLSYYLEGVVKVTMGMIGKSLFDVIDSAHLTENQRKYIENGLIEIFSTHIRIESDFTIDTANAMKNITLKEEKNVDIREYDLLFPGRLTTAYVKGKIVDSVAILDRMPSLYKLQTALNGCVIRTPMKYLGTPGTNDIDKVTIKGYLWRRVEAMKNKNNNIHRNTILFEKILSEVGAKRDRSQRNRISSIKKKTENILNAWKKNGYIKDYEELTKDNKKISGKVSLYKIKIIF